MLLDLVNNVADAFKRGKSVQTIADWFELDVDVVEQALREHINYLSIDSTPPQQQGRAGACQIGD